MLLAAYMMYLLFGSFGNAILVAEGSQLHPCSISYPMTDPNGVAIYGVPWIPSTKTPVMLALIYQQHMDPMNPIWL